MGLTSVNLLKIIISKNSNYQVILAMSFLKKNNPLDDNCKKL